MRSEQRQEAFQTPTAHLAQTMTLITLTVGELRQHIESEVSANPALEIVDERRCPNCRRLLPERGACPYCSLPKSPLQDEPVVFISPKEDFYSRKVVTEDYGEEDIPQAEDDLPTHVLRQIASDLRPEDRQIAVFLLMNLDDDGLLTTTLQEVASYFHIPLTRVRSIHSLIKHADPVGVGAYEPQEALLVQLETLAELQIIPELAIRAIEEGLDFLMRRQYDDLAKMLNTNVRNVRQIEKFISENLNPFPARSHWGEASRSQVEKNNVYHQPDVIINYLNDDPKNVLVVELIYPISGTLRVNPMFKQAVQEARETNIEEWKEDLERATLFVKCLQQRNNTMQRLMARLGTLQRDFINQGEQYLKSVTRVQIAEELSLHESTVSRAVSNKSVQLPNKRIVPLSMFFDRNLNVRTILRDIIAQEKKPYSDIELARILEERGIKIARRTVAKYRAMEGILPAHLRQVLISH